MTDIFALDLGTTKFCLAKMQYTRGEAPKITLITVPSRGMRRGMLSEFDQVTQGIKHLIETAERQLNQDIHKVVVGVAGAHLRSICHKEIATNFSNPINSTLIKSLERRASKSINIAGREVLHTIPTHYVLDERAPTINPLNMNAKEIASHYFTISADQMYLRDIVTSVNQSGLEVARIYAEPLASATVVVPNSSKNLGVVSLDIGGGTTDAIVYVNGNPVDCFTIDIGGILMTHDIAVCLKISIQDAERVKGYFGLSGEMSSQSLEVEDPSGLKRMVRGLDVQKILGHRIMEWAEKLSTSLSQYRGKLGAGILITGGGSMVLNLPKVLSHVFKLPVSRVYPTLLREDTRDSFAEMFATVVGMLHLEYEQLNRELQANSESWHPPLFRNIIKWVREFS